MNAKRAVLRGALWALLASVITVPFVAWLLTYRQAAPSGIKARPDTEEQAKQWETMAPAWIPPWPDYSFGEYEAVGVKVEILGVLGSSSHPERNAYVVWDGRAWIADGVTFWHEHPELDEADRKAGMMSAQAPYDRASSAWGGALFFLKVCEVGWPARCFRGGAFVVENNFAPIPPNARRQWRIANTGPLPTTLGSLEQYRIIPIGPIWGGLLINLACYWGTFMALGTAAWHLRRWNRRRRGRCPQCAYSLHAQQEDGCPECGWNRAGAMAL